MATPLLGWISPQDRTNAQHDAHAAAVAMMPRFALPVPTLAKGQAVRLFDYWKHPSVVAEVGFVFERCHQVTGSCVNCGGQNAVFSTVAAQRVAGEHPTKAFLPFTWHNYALSRHYMGDDGQGEGSLGSTFAKSLREDGIRDWVSGANLPNYTREDGVMISSRDEMAWSSVRNPGVAEVLKVSKAHLFGSAAECKSAQDIKAMVCNGYGVTFACDCYIGNGRVVGSGDNAVVLGKWDGNGGHQQSIHGYFEHPDLGPLYLALNNWPRNTYPILPTQPVCSTWVKEADVDDAIRRYNAEVYGLSHLDWFPANPRVLDGYI